MDDIVDFNIERKMHSLSPPEAWGCRISPDRGGPDECDAAVLFQKSGIGAERKLTGKRGSLTKKLKSVLAKIQIFV